MAITGFTPHPLLRGGARQTLIGACLGAPPSGPFEPVEIELEAGERILALRTLAAGRTRGRLLILHGLGGSAESGPCLQSLAVAHERGWEVVRVNARGAGEGRPLSRRLAHAGRWDDIAAVLAARPWSPAADGPVAALGFSLGGAVLLAHLGATGADCGLDAAIAVSPPTDLAWCLGELERPRHLAYHLYYVARLRRNLAERARRHPDLGPPPRLAHRSVRRIDTDFVAADAGFDSAEAYYAGCSARRLMGGIRAPTLVIAADDDPFVPAAMLRRDCALSDRVRLHRTAMGGHVGWVDRGPRLAPRPWLPAAAMGALEGLLGMGHGLLP